jgi:hypothetical protein
VALAVMRAASLVAVTTRLSPGKLLPVYWLVHTTPKVL